MQKSPRDQGESKKVSLLAVGLFLLGTFGVLAIIGTSEYVPDWVSDLLFALAVVVGTAAAILLLIGLVSQR